jgi:hypothetical protein
MVPTIEAALAKEAFTPYAGLGVVAGDGLARNETGTQLAAACMTDAGYPNDDADVQVMAQIPAGLGGGPPFGHWGYVGTTEAAQYGFEPAGFGFAAGPPPGTGSSDLSDAAQAAVNKCSNIIMDFSNAQQNSSLAGILAMSQTILDAVSTDPSVLKATTAWAACMTANGYHSTDPNTLLHEESTHITPGSAPPSPTAAQKAAQIAVAEADAACTQSTDLAGIYFAVQASYEQQVVDANQQRLNTAVQQYRAAYQKELDSLPTLLRTTPTTPPGNGPKAG